MTSTETELCERFTEHPGWRNKHPTGPVTWDAWCSLCGFKLEDRPYSDGSTINGDGRRLAFSRIGFGRYIVCSECNPN